MIVKSTKPSFDLYDEPKLHMERLLRALLVEFDLEDKILYRLADNGIRTLGDLVDNDPRDLQRRCKFGQAAMSAIKKFLSHYLLEMKKGRN